MYSKYNVSLNFMVLNKTPRNNDSYFSFSHHPLSYFHREKEIETYIQCLFLVDKIFVDFGLDIFFDSSLVVFNVK